MKKQLEMKFGCPLMRRNDKSKIINKCIEHNPASSKE